MPSIFAGLLLFVLQLAPPGGTGGAGLRRPMTVDDGLNLVRVGGALLSPDGEWVFYSRSELDWGENKRKTTYHHMPVDGGEEQGFQFIGEEGGSSFQFSPDGKYLSFVRKADEDSQIFLMRTAGGEGVALTEHEGGVGSYRWSGDSRRLFFTAAKPKSDEEKKAEKAGEDAIFVDEGPNGQRAGRWRQLWMFDLASKKEILLTDDDLIVGSFDPSPDGQRVVYSARRENRRNQRYLSELYVLDVSDRVARRLTENEAPEGGVLWSPEGDLFVYTAPDDETWELRLQKLWLMDPDTGAHRLLSGNFQGNLRGATWVPDGSALLFTGQQGVNTNLYRLDVESGAVTRLSELEGSVSGASFSADRSRVVYGFSDHDSPADLYVSELAEFAPRRLTDANPWVEKELLLARGETLRWRSRDGLEIEGLLYLPASYRVGNRLPLVLNIHGGPAGSFRNSFRSSYHVYAGLGYASLCPNVRGSSGYTDELLRGNMEDIGGGDYDDLMSGVDELIERGMVDPERMAVRGWSYGGILGGVTITRTDRFRAASLGAMVSDWTSEYGPGFNHDVRLWYIGGTPWENPERYRELSALTHVAKVKTPTILFHGIEDTTDTEPQSMMFYAALKDRGVPVRYLRFPREPHGFREPRHQRIRDVEEIRWMQKHVLGVEWEPWERPAASK